MRTYGDPMSDAPGIAELKVGEDDAPATSIYAISRAGETLAVYDGRVYYQGEWDQLPLDDYLLAEDWAGGEHDDELIVGDITRTDDGQNIVRAFLDDWEADPEWDSDGSYRAQAEQAIAVYEVSRIEADEDDEEDDQ